MEIISVVNFSDFPGLRHSDISDDSGEDFYHEVLNEAFKNALKNKEKLKVDLDFVDAYTPSFIDEAFGNLVYDFTLEKVKHTLEIKSDEEPYWINKIEGETYKKWEERRLKNEDPKITKARKPWYRLVNGELILDKWLQPSL